MIFTIANVVSTLLQIKNVLQLIIELYVHQFHNIHSGKLGCKPPLSTNFQEKIFKSYLPRCIKF